MNENNINEKKEKKKIKLRLKTFADLKRFKSRQLHKIVEKFRKKNKGMNLEELIENAEFFKSMGYVVRQTLINRSDANKKKTIERLNEEIKEGNKEYKEYKKDLEEGKLTKKEQKKMQKEYEDKKYKMAKEIYTKDLGPKNQEKPKNPKVQRAVNNVKKAAKIAGKGIAVALASPFILGYKLGEGAIKVAKAVGRGVKRLGRGANVARLTAGRVVKNTVEPTVNKIKETVKETKENVQETKFEVKKEVYDNSSEKVQKEIFNRDYEKALKEDAKREREAARRESLHMNKEEQPINHKEAIEKVEGEVLTPEEEKEVYGDQEK